MPPKSQEKVIDTMGRFLFVTGMPRSGTTLVDKLLSAQPGVHVLSQPLPLLYVDVKRAFLRTRQDSHATFREYPLADMFGPTYYPVEDFASFLEGFRLSADFCRQSLNAMISFRGQYTKPEHPLKLLPEGSSGLFDFVRHYTRSLVPTGSNLIGSKETYCEEYVPYFLDRGARVILLVRDPRDVLTSLNHGRGRDHGGLPKPTLFTLRQWRKSAAFALALGSKAGLLAIRYEQLVLEPETTLAHICRVLEIPDAVEHVGSRTLRSQTGKVWRSNSSHFESPQVTSRSVGRYREFLSHELDRFVQAVCLPEMRALGYAPDIDEQEVVPTLQGYEELEPLERPALAAYQWSPDRRSEELARWSDLTSRRFDPSHFIFPESFALLCRSIVKGAT